MQRWQEFSADPNAPELREHRAQALCEARASTLIYDRTRYLSDLIAGKSVLDVGVVEHTREACESPDWLHRHLCRSAARCLGVDILSKEIDYLRGKGFDVACADVTKEALSQKFDVIIAGEVIEHIDAPGKFMDHCAQMLEPGGRLVITVPNPWYANRAWKNTWGRFVFLDSADHVAWYDASTLYELGQRYRLTLRRYTGVGVTNPRTLRAKLFLFLQPLLIATGFDPKLFANSIIYEFVRE